MRSLSILLTSLALASTVSAQDTNQFGIYPDQCGGCGLATNGLYGFGPGISADFLTKFDRQFFQGVGQFQTSGAVAGQMNGFSITIQDQDAFTQEQFAIVVYADDSTGQPDPANLLFQSEQFGTPASTSASTPQAWTLEADFATPFTGIPQTDTFYFGTNFVTASSQFDGLNIWGTTYDDIGREQFGRDNPRPAAPGVGWLIQQPQQAIFVSQYVFPIPGGGGTTVTSEVLFNQFLLTPGATLNTGADVISTAVPSTSPNPGFGAAGLYPNSSGRADGTAVLMRAADLSLAPGAIWLSAGLTNTPFGLPGTTSGNIHLDLTSLVVLPTPVSLDSEGVFEGVVIPQGTPVLTSLVGTLNYQGLLLDIFGSRVRLTNTSGVDYR